MPNLPPWPLLVLYAIVLTLMTAFVAARKYGLAAVVPLPAMALGLLATSPMVFLAGCGLLLLTAVGANFRLAWYSFGGIMLCLLIGICVVHHFDVQPGLLELAALRKQFPAQSLKERLAFQEKYPIEGGREAASRFQTGTDRMSYRSRAWNLQRLHEDSYERFVAAAGFGGFRMPWVSRGKIELPPQMQTPVVANEICFDNREIPGRPAPDDDDLTKLHHTGLNEFLDEERLGYIESIDRVIGFEPHAVQTLPAAIPASSETWRVARLELVSLLKHDSPAVYISDSLPNLDQLKNLTTRDLDDFEQSSLARLRGDEEIVVDNQPTAIRMLGAVRAGEVCLACHQVPQKTLLGAFSYELRPLRHDQTDTTDAN